MAEIAPRNMTSNTAPSPYVVDQSSYYASNFYKGWRAFDSTANYWISNASSSGWISIDLGSSASYILNSYNVVVNSIPEPNRAPKDWTMEGSNNGTDWTVIDTVTNQTSWGSGENRAFTCDTRTTAYRYFRINITANNGDAYLQVDELYLQSVDPATGNFFQFF